MNPPLLITLSLLFISFTTKLPLAFSDDKLIISSASGEPITTGEVIYIFPDYASSSDDSSKGGGLILSQTENSTCPLTILQHFSSEFNGLPVVLWTTPQNRNTRNINVTTSTSFDITFVHKPVNCAKSFKWVVIDDGDCPYPWIGVGGAQDYPGKKILSGRFHIQRVFNGSYKLVFCPTSTRGFCKDVGRHQDMHGRRLILTDKDPFLVEFLRSHDIL